jgi:hypothetical protein
MELDQWTYRAKLDDVVDGDTVDLEVDLGFRTYKSIRVRLPGIDTAEMWGVERSTERYKTALKQHKFVEEQLKPETTEEWHLVFKSSGESGKYGRWIGDVKKKGDEEFLSEKLVDEWPGIEVTEE